MPITPEPEAVIALDVGDKRVGVATASMAARLPRPLATLDRGDGFLAELQRLLEAESAGAIIVGLPRGLEGQPTEQTARTEAFITQLKEAVDMPIYTQDEALTSQKAEAELDARGTPYNRGDIDALAATYILEDFLAGYNRESS
ncbi:MAG TPA: Holliday junction resolvase RuvX [Candidatus Saccharimonadales bacterium]|nr:Holliday junction resolvase RuvX [Candidatus Saccharimonadales bacterium]